MIKCKQYKNNEQPNIKMAKKKLHLSVFEIKIKDKKKNKLRALGPDIYSEPGSALLPFSKA